MGPRPIRTRAEWMLGHQRVLEARDPTTTVERLRALADDGARPVRVWVALNFRTPPDALERLAQDEDDYVRARASYNLTLPDVAARWRANPDRTYPEGQYNGMLHDMVHHPGTPEDLRAELVAAAQCPDWCRDHSASPVSD
jgi:hypothetical protein